MTASFEGHVDIVRILINADAEIDTQDEVCSLSHTAHIFIKFSKLTVSVHRLAGLLFTWQLKKIKLML